MSPLPVEADTTEEGSKLVGDPEQARQALRIKMRRYPHRTDRGASDLLGGLRVPVTLHAVAVPGDDSGTLDSGHFAIRD